MTESLSHSARATLTRCARKYKYQYVDELEPKGTSKPLRMGSAYSDALEHWTVDAAYDFYAELFMSASNNTDMQYLKEELAVVVALADTYMQLVPKHEREYEFNLDNGFNGFIDGYMDDYTLVENKCLSQWNTMREDALALDDQVTGYIAAWHLTKNIPVEDITLQYHVALKPMIRQKKSESNVEFEARLAEVIYSDPTKHHIHCETSRTQQQVAEWLDSLDVSKKLMDMYKEDGSYPMNTSNCLLYNSKCPFMDVCITGNEQLLEDNFQRKEKRNG